MKLGMKIHVISIFRRIITCVLMNVITINECTWVPEWMNVFHEVFHQFHVCICMCYSSGCTFSFISIPGKSIYAKNFDVYKRYYGMSLYKRTSNIPLMLLRHSSMRIYTVLYSSFHSVWCNNYSALYAVNCCMLYFYLNISGVSSREIQIIKVLLYCYILLILLYIYVTWFWKTNQVGMSRNTDLNIQATVVPLC